MINEIKEKSSKKMELCIKNFQIHINQIRTGRASPDLLNNIYIDYFGVRTPLRQISNIVVEDFHTLKINVFDESITNLIKKSILNSKLDLNPISYGKDIRVPLPSLTEDRRRDLIKLVRSEAENSRILIRNIRRDTNDKVKNFLKNKIISLDQERNMQNNVQSLTNKFIKMIDNILLEKEQELMQF